MGSQQAERRERGRGGVTTPQGWRWASVLGLVAAVTALSAPAGTAEANRVAGKVVAEGRSASVASAFASRIARPQAIYGRAVGRVTGASFIVTCNRGLSSSSRTLERDAAGTWKLPMMAWPDSCTVAASVGGAGAVHVEIRVVQRPLPFRSTRV
jgi:hypothetical protein